MRRRGLNTREITTSIFGDREMLDVNNRGAARTSGFDETVDLTSLDIRVPPTLALTIEARVTSGSASAITAGLVWLEDV